MGADSSLITTVLGPVGCDGLGIVLPHEHIFLDLTNQFTEPADEEKRRLSREEISLSNYGILRRNPYALKTNLVLDDLDLAVEELLEFRKAGGGTVVDCTPAGIGRNPRLLKAVAERTGLNVIAGCGYYTGDTHPPELADWTEDEIADRIVRDLTAGMDDSEVRAGIIGEIGTSSPLHPMEVKVLRSVALAWKAAHAPIQVHTYPWGRDGLEAADILVRAGVNPGHIVICHADVMPDLDYMVDLLKMGVYVEFDNFGKEFCIDPSDMGFAGGIFVSDRERVRALNRLCDIGYEDRLLITNDICLKQMLHKYGGWGYDHVLRNIVPMMLNEGIPDRTVERLLIDNPKRWLSAR